MTENMRKVEVVPHRDEWEVLFDLEAERLKEVFKEQAVNIHHIGSTAIPGIAAKPIIDIIVEVKDLSAVNKHNNAMKQLGYIAKGEFGIPGRRFFIKGSETERSHHVHVYEVGDVEVARHVNFRDFLSQHPDVAKSYSELKQELAEQYPFDIESYMDGKNVFFRDVEMKINIWKKNIEKDLF